MKHGEIWLISARSAAPPSRTLRPVLVIDCDGSPDSVCVVPLTTRRSEGAGALTLSPDIENGLEMAAEVQVDRPERLPAAALLRRLGALSIADLAQIDAALARRQACAGPRDDRDT